jgi:hypothetical protein
VQPVFLYPGVTDARLNNWPTQIYSFSATVGEAENVPMTDWVEDDGDFVWEVEKDTFDGHDYLRIKSGRWFYDPDNNRVVLPSTYKDPDSHDELNIWDLNSNLYGDPNTIFSLKTLPSTLSVEYFVGNGMPIEVPVTAVGPGPSYQLEAECVQFIHNHSDDAQAAPAGISSDPMPDMGSSLPLKTNNLNTVPLKWQVYNHEPLIGIVRLVGSLATNSRLELGVTMPFLAFSAAARVATCQISVLAPHWAAPPRARSPSTGRPIQSSPEDSCLRKGVDKADLQNDRWKCHGHGANWRLSLRSFHIQARHHR